MYLAKHFALNGKIKELDESSRQGHELNALLLSANKNLNEQIIDLNRSLEQKQHKIKQLEEQIVLHLTECFAMNENIRELDASSRQDHELSALLLSTNNDLNEQIIDLNRSLEQEYQKIKQLEEQNVLHLAKHFAANEKIKELDASSRQRHELNALLLLANTNLNEKIADLSRNFEQKQERIRQLEEQNRSHLTKHFEQDERIKGLDTSLRQKQGQNVLLLSANNDLNEHITDLKTLLEEGRQKAQQLQRETALENLQLLKYFDRYRQNSRFGESVFSLKKLIGKYYTQAVHEDWLERTIKEQFTMMGMNSDITSEMQQKWETIKEMKGVLDIPQELRNMRNRLIRKTQELGYEKQNIMMRNLMVQVESHFESCEIYQTTELAAHKISHNFRKIGSHFKEFEVQIKDDFVTHHINKVESHFQTFERKTKENRATCNINRINSYFAEFESRKKCEEKRFVSKVEEYAPKVNSKQIDISNDRVLKGFMIAFRLVGLLGLSLLIPGAIAI